ncbi:MAG TPA: cardiolipin synthase, partial [Ktedonobacteraceae bacterium]|nr:cardiolipin synthase [Ktedonobacteraceae bacterium]
MAWRLTWQADVLITILIFWIVCLVLLFIIPRNRKPSSATAWLLLMYIVPVVGIIIFLLIGSPKLSKRRRAMQSTMNATITKAVVEAQSQQEFNALLQPPIPARYEPFVRLNTKLGGLPAFAGNAVELLSDYPTNIVCIAQEIEKAQRYVHMEYFTLSYDEETKEIFAALERAHKRGVKVRVLLDHLGSRSIPTFKKTKAWFEGVGIEYHVVLPLHFFGPKYTRFDLRNHRKIVVIDGQVGFTGSQNMIKRNYFRKDSIYYDELVAKVTGPVVNQLDAAFRTDWYSETSMLLNTDTAAETELVWIEAGDVLCQVLPSGSGFDNENNLKLFTSMIHAAREKLVITNPYFVPDDALTTAIVSAAERGVDVTLINSEAMDQFFVGNAERSYYEELLGAGVNVYQYKAPILLHTKTISIDDDIAVIGSSNLDMRSFHLNLEVTLVCYDARVVADLR